MLLRRLGELLRSIGQEYVLARYEPIDPLGPYPSAEHRGPEGVRLDDARPEPGRTRR